MHDHAFMSFAVDPGSETPCLADAAYQGTAPKEERLPFTIRLAHSEEDLCKAVQVRHMAYARHLPELADRLKTPELLDYSSDAGVLLAESKLDGSPLGTVRLQTNDHTPLLVEQSVPLPAGLNGLRLAEATRLAVGGGRLGHLVKIALIKACLEYCRSHDVDWAIAAGRAPIDRQYEELMFTDLFPDLGYIPLKHAGNLPHRIMALEVRTLHARWSAANHPLLGFFSSTCHPDIRLDAGTASTPPAPTACTMPP